MGSRLRTRFECLRNLNECLRMISHLENAPWPRGLRKTYENIDIFHLDLEGMNPQQNQAYKL